MNLWMSANAPSIWHSEHVKALLDHVSLCGSEVVRLVPLDAMLEAADISYPRQNERKAGRGRRVIIGPESTSPF